MAVESSLFTATTLQVSVEQQIKAGELLLNRKVFVTGSLYSLSMQSLLPHAGFNVSHSSIDAVQGLGSSLVHLLHMTCALAASGRAVDITGLDQQIGLLCAKALDLMPEDGRALRPMLVGLLADIDALSIILADQKDTSATQPA